MIQIAGEALFDVLQKNEAKFRSEYVDCILKIHYENEKSHGEDFYGDIDYNINVIHITKEAFMELLLNRVYICDEFTIKVSL